MLRKRGVRARAFGATPVDDALAGSRLLIASLFVPGRYCEELLPSLLRRGEDDIGMMLGILLERVGLDDLGQRTVCNEHDPGIVAEALTQAGLDPRLQRSTIRFAPVGLETHVAGGQHRTHFRKAKVGEELRQVGTAHGDAVDVDPAQQRYPVAHTAILQVGECTSASRATLTGVAGRALSEATMSKEGSDRGRYHRPMHASATFSVHDWAPTPVVPVPEVETGTPVGVATMRKVFTGTVNGQSSTIFAAAFDHVTGTYLALKSFQGEIGGRSGTFVFGHSATTTGTDRRSAFFVVVPNSGTGDLAGLTGTGELIVDPDGTHRLELDYQLPG